MEAKSGSPAAEKDGNQSSSVLLTYFQGDINSMVDEHFSRALKKASKPKDLSNKSKGNRRIAKAGKRVFTVQHGDRTHQQHHPVEQQQFPPAFSEDLTPVQWGFPGVSWEPPCPSTSSGQIQFSMLEDAHSPQRVMTSPSSLWSFAPRPSAGFGLPAVVYPPLGPTEVPGPADRPYTSSFLGLLHSDRPVGRTTLSSPSKPDLSPGWNPPTGFRDPLESGISLDSGTHVPEKRKDLYWY